jgi:hypothetical protein
MLTQAQIHELYDYSVQYKNTYYTYLDGKVVSETSSEYIDVELNITGLQHIKYRILRPQYNLLL